jgi:EpsI family protein
MLFVTAIIHMVIGRAHNSEAEAATMPVLEHIPAEILEFRQVVPDSEVPESIREGLETNSILMRYYVSTTGWPVQLTIVHAEKTRRSLHFPEVCFTGQGWETTAKSSVPVGVLFMGQGLVVQKDDAREAVLYWFKTGDHFTASYFANTAVWSRDRLFGRNPSSMLIRLSTPITNQGEAKAFQVLSDFASGLAPILSESPF